jgi:hypothetical protein
MQPVWFLCMSQHDTTMYVANGPHDPPIQWAQGTLSLVEKWQGHEIDHSSQTSDEAKKREAIPPLPHMPSWHSA